MNDDIVDYRQGVAFVEQCASADVDLVLLKNGDHRLTARKAELAELLLLYLEHRWGKDGGSPSPPRLHSPVIQP